MLRAPAMGQAAPLPRRRAKRPACRARSAARLRGVERWRLRPRPTHGPGPRALSQLWGGRSQCPAGARCSCGLGHGAGHGVTSVLGARRGGSGRQVGLEPARPGGWRRGAGAVARGGWRRGCGGPGAFPGPGRPGRGRGRTAGRGSVSLAPRPGCSAMRMRTEFGDAAPAGTVALGAASGRRAVGPRARTRVFSRVPAPGMGARRRGGARVWVSRRGRRGGGAGLARSGPRLSPGEPAWGRGARSARSESAPPAWRGRPIPRASGFAGSCVSG